MRVDNKFLASKLRDGDSEAYKFLYDSYYVMLCRYSYRIVKEYDTAESIVSDLLLHLWESRTTLVLHPPIRNYLIKAVRNRSLNHLALKRNKVEVDIGNYHLHTIEQQSSQDPLDAIINEELEKRIKYAIGKLPKVCRKVFIMSRYEGVAHAQIAEQLEISENTVKYHIKRALLELKTELKNFK